MGEPLYYVPPAVYLQVLHVNVGLFFMCCRKRKSLMTLMTNDLNDHPR